MFSVIEPPTYLRSVAAFWSDEDAAAFVDFIAANPPQAGDVMPGTKGLRKVRWSRTVAGKRGGVPAIHLVRVSRGHVLLLMAYTKSKFDTLPAEFLARLKEQCDV